MSEQPTPAPQPKVEALSREAMLALTIGSFDLHLHGLESAVKNVLASRRKMISGNQEAVLINALDHLAETLNRKRPEWPKLPDAPAAAQTERVREAVEQKDAAYLERNQVVAALAAAYPSGIAKTAIEGWDEAWHGCVYIDLPTGQASWHYHESQAHLFAHLPPYTKPWDGHTTEEKYARLAALSAPHLRDSGADADGLLREALSLLEEYTTGHLEESGSVVCTCCEKRKCAPDCHVEKGIARIRAHLDRSGGCR